MPTLPFRAFTYVRHARSLLLGLLLTLLAGCCSLGGLVGADTKVNLDFEVWPKINPDEMGRAKPLLVRVYELKDARQFLSEDYLGLIQNSKELLGGDLVAERRLRELTPGLNHTEELVVDPSVRYIGLLGEFIQYESAQSRVVFPINANCRTRQYVWLNGNRLELGDAPKPEDAN